MLNQKAARKLLEASSPLLLTTFVMSGDHRPHPGNRVASTFSTRLLPEFYQSPTAATNGIWTILVYSKKGAARQAEPLVVKRSTFGVQRTHFPTPAAAALLWILSIASLTVKLAALARGGNIFARSPGRHRIGRVMYLPISVGDTVGSAFKRICAQVVHIGNT
jgi:hypothetical protein